MALVLLGLAMQCRFVRRGGLAALLLAAACFAIATLTRSTGMAFLPLPLLAALFDRRVALAPGALRAAICAGMPVLCVLIRHDLDLEPWRAFRDRLLGRDFGARQIAGAAAAGRVAAAAEAARGQVAEAAADVAPTDRRPARHRGPAAGADAGRSDVRFAVFWPVADREWPEWVAAEGGSGPAGRAISAP